MSTSSSSVSYIHQHQGPNGSFDCHNRRRCHLRFREEQTKECDDKIAASNFQINYAKKQLAQIQKTFKGYVASIVLKCCDRIQSLILRIFPSLAPDVKTQYDLNGIIFYQTFEINSFNLTKSSDPEKDLKIYHAEKNLMDVFGGPEQFENLPYLGPLPENIFGIFEAASHLYWSPRGVPVERGILDGNLYVAFKAQKIENTKETRASVVIHIDSEGKCHVCNGSVLGVNFKDDLFEDPKAVDNLKALLAGNSTETGYTLYKTQPKTEKPKESDVIESI